MEEPKTWVGGKIVNYERQDGIIVFDLETVDGERLSLRVPRRMPYVEGSIEIKIKEATSEPTK